MSLSKLIDSLMENTNADLQHYDITVRYEGSWEDNAAELDGIQTNFINLFNIKIEPGHTECITWRKKRAVQ